MSIEHCSKKSEGYRYKNNFCICTIIRIRVIQISLKKSNSIKKVCVYKNKLLQKGVDPFEVNRDRWKSLIENQQIHDFRRCLSSLIWLTFGQNLS